MKKKNILAIGITTVLVAGIMTSTMLVSQRDATADAYKLKTYIYQPVSILDNKIDTGSTYLLPFIFKSSGDRIIKSYLEEEFAKANLTIESISSSTIGTGTTIKVAGESKPYQVLIYGDVDGNGRIGLADAQRIIDHFLGDDPSKELKGVYYTAANVNNSDERANLVDAQRIIDFYIGDRDTILSNPPADDKITGIEVSAPDKVIYNYGEELDLTGVKVRRTTASNAKCIWEALPENSVTGYDKTVAGQQTLTVSYAGFITTISVRVLEPITTLTIDESCKTEDRSVAKQMVLGSIKQGEGQSYLDKSLLKTHVTSSATGEVDDTVVVSYKFRSEVFKDFTDENKNDIIVVATAVREGDYQIISYLGESFDDAVKSNAVIVTVENKTTIGKIEIDGNLTLIPDNTDITGIDIPNAKIYTETKTIQGTTQSVHYTLLPVSFKDQYGNDQKLTISSFAGYEDSIADKITVSDNYGFEIPGVEVKLFRNRTINGVQEVVEAGGDNTFDYIGFAPVYNIDTTKLEGGIVTITYGMSNLQDAVQANLEVNVIK